MALGLGALSAVAFYYRYWLWRDCFNDLGRCYDPGTEEVYVEQAGVIWGGLAALFLVGGFALILWRSRRAAGREP